MLINTAPPRHALTNAVQDWKDLIPGQTVYVATDDGWVTRAVVDTINDDGSIMWLRNEPIGDRSLHLKTDPLTVYKL